jgi:hypothetical protein
MKFNHHLAMGVSFFALAAMTSPGATAFNLPLRTRPPLGARGHIGPYELPYRAPKSAKSGTWTDLTGTLPFAGGPDTAELLTDGTVLEYDGCQGQWFKLTPDNKGKYEDGTWSSATAMPSGYTPLFFATEILPDGRMIVNGGEYIGCNLVWTNRGALYDPVANTWTTVSPPSGWKYVGDASSAILPDGSYILADCCDEAAAIATISGTTVTWTSTGSGKGDPNLEEGWTILPDGNLLTVDVGNIGMNYDDYEIYDTSEGTWSTPGRTPNLLTTKQTREIGPAVLRPDGTVIQFGASPRSGYNDLYTIKTGKWSVAPVMKVGGTIYDCADAPAALLPDGNVIVQASPGTYKSPSHFWEFSTNKKGKMKLTQVDDTKTAPIDSSFFGRFLELPTGQLFWANMGEVQNVTAEVATYTPQGKPESAWLPVVSSVSSTLKVGSTGNTFSGTNFNGFSQGAAYGDDAQMSTNYPLVRITNTNTGDVCFGRTYNFSTMGVWTQGTTNAVFDLPSTCETGASTLQVVVNGLASTGTAVTLQS